MAAPRHRYLAWLKENDPAELKRITTRGGTTSQARAHAEQAKHVTCAEKDDWTLDELRTHDWNNCRTGNALQNALNAFAREQAR